MATISNDWPGRESVPLDALPFEAARLDADAVIVAANPAWLAAHPQAAAGRSCLKWCDEIHGAAPELRSDLLAGLEGVLTRRRTRFTQEYRAEHGRCRILLSPCPGGALILHQRLSPGEQPPDDADRLQAHRMETIGRLAGGIAHDFANLLTLVAGHADLLLGRLGPRDPLRAGLDEIRKAVARGSRLTAQLLGFTRGQTVQPRALDLNALIDDMHRMLQPIIGEHLQLQTSLSPNLGAVVADPGQMEQVIMNLVLNARDAMPAGGRIRIATRAAELDERDARAHGMRPGAVVMVSVGDEGHGIDPETMSHIFEPFFSTKERGKGTGLGLSTVHSIVKQSGGAVWAGSAPGAGATFTVCLPRAPENRVPRENFPETRAGARGAETVLLVEDAEDVRRLMTHVLEQRGYRVFEAATGEEALRIFESRAPEIELLLTDMVLPRTTGRELAGRVLRIRPETRVLLMTGYTEDVLVRTGAVVPGMSFLQKPLRPEALAAKVREALDSPARPFDPP